MARRRDYTDAEIVKLVFDWRVLNGACTLNDISRATGKSITETARRVKLMIEAGILTRSKTAGSIRATSERIWEELPDGRVLERSLR